MDRLAPSGTPARGIGDLAAAALVVVVALATYLRSLGVGFLSDDFLILGRIRDLGGLQHPLAYFGSAFYDYYRPFVFLSQAFDWSIWGRDAAGFHATNVALHAFNALAVFLIGRRLAGRAASMWGALLFAVHPACRESVFWVAGRFDLVATAALLGGLWCFARGSRPGYWTAVALFAVALLSKESGVAMLVLAPAFDVFVRGLAGRRVVQRLLPFLGVAAAYTVLRAAADVSPLGGLHRVGKLVLLVGGLLVVLWMAYRHRPAAPAAPGNGRRMSPVVASLAGAGVGAVALVAGMQPLLGPTVGFAWYAAYYLGPLAWLPAGTAVSPGTMTYLAAGAAVIAIATGVLLANLHRLRRQPGLLFALAFLAAALIPVLSMPSQTHMYLGVAGMAFVIDVLMGSLPGRRLAAAAIVALVTVGAAEAVVAAGDWRRAGAMTRQAVAAIDAEPGVCSDGGVVLLTAPANIRGVPCNLNDQAFAVLGTCVPGVRPLLRVVGGDITATASTSPGRILLEVEGYRGNLVGTSDLQHFNIQIPRGHTATIDTPLGRLRMWPENGAERFELTSAAENGPGPVYFYSDGAVRRVPIGPAIR